jgi:1-acyl-sn-glycerol-3-phosphate acyltransferase
MDFVQNLFRVCLSVGWTAAVGVPLMVVLYARYAVASVYRTVGRAELARERIDRNVVSISTAAQRYWAPVLSRLTRVRLHRIDRAPIDWTRTHVICANHASVFDIIALAGVVPIPFRFVAKRELLRWPVVGWVLPPAGQIVIDRSDTAAAIAAIESAKRDGLHGQILFFVEGTRTRDGRLLPFKKGAFRFALENDLPLLPTAICGSYGVLGRTLWWRMKTGRDIRVVLGKPIDPAGIAPGEEMPVRVAAAMEAVRAAIAAEVDADQRTA